MSADDGIYILETKDQYRVIHTQAIDNLWWSHIDRRSHSELIPTRIVEYYGQLKSYKTKDEVKNRAFELYDLSKPYDPEYGIQTISIDKTWDQILTEAKELAPLEIEAINLDNDGRWDYNLRRLNEVLTC